MITVSPMFKCTSVKRLPIVFHTRSASSSSSPVPYQLSPWRRFLQTLGRVTLVTILTSGGLLIYIAYKDRTPGPQQPFDPAKKTIAILGSGWGATSFLKSLDNEEYNVVRLSSLSVGCEPSPDYHFW